MYISTYEASVILNCSRNHVIHCIKDGRLKFKIEKLQTREVYLINEASVKRYLLTARENKRIGRELFCRQPARKPYKSKGYVYIHKPDHPRATQDGYVGEHVLVMEAHLQRSLERKEVVHHINRVRDDNRIDNLMVFSSAAEHMKLAHSEFKRAIYRVANNPELEQKVIDFINSLFER